MLGRKKGKSKGRSAGGSSPLESIAMPSSPQNIVIDNGSAQQIQTLPPVPAQEEPSGRGGGVRVEELQRLMNQNPHLQALYNGQIDMHQLSDGELRRLEARFHSHMEAGNSAPQKSAPSVTAPPAPPKLNPSDLGPSLGAEGALAPQGLMSPKGLLMSYGFMGPQGLLRPRSDGVRPGSLTPKPQQQKAPASPVSQAPPGNTPPKNSPGPAQNQSFSSDIGNHFKPVDSLGSAFQTSRASKSPFAEVLGKFFALVAGLFGIGPQGSNILPGSGGSGPVVTPGSSSKRS